MTSKTDKTPSIFRTTDKATLAEQRDRLVFAEIEKTRRETDARTVRLRALRLEKEAADAAAAAANPPPPVKTRARKAPAA